MSRIVKPYPGMVITQSVTFEPGRYDFTGGEGIVIAADNIEIDGGGAALAGGCAPLPRERRTKDRPDNGAELGFFGTGITIRGRAGVTVRNLTVSGFDIGLGAADCAGLAIRGCDFTGCFTDPAWGWDDHGFHGGILWEKVCGGIIENCRAEGVWDALNMRFSDNNKVAGNRFSHCSDTGLKLWRCCGNEIVANDFSYGIRIDPGEVHARDSSCVLIECGSNGNTFAGNDMTHGGDGLFIRVLNGWMSTGNTFADNDCSYANNNAIEAWADGNSYIGNKANHSSYGFWLGGSDNTVVRGNEIAHNGGQNHNAPEAFGNAGLSVVNASGCHFVVEGNHIHDNCGPGMAIRFLKDRPSFHWVIQGNVIANNRNAGRYRGHGIYAKNARFLVIGRNEIAGNEGEGICFDANVSDVVMLDGNARDIPQIKLTMTPLTPVAGEDISFEAEGGAELRCRWDFGDGAVAQGPAVRHRYARAGFYRAAVAADNGAYAAPGFRYVYVLPSRAMLAANAGDWAVTGDSPAYGIRNDAAHTVSGRGSVCLAAEGGAAHCARFPASGPLRFRLGENRTFHFFMKYSAEAGMERSQGGRKPVVTLLRDAGNYLRFTPDAGMMDLAFCTENEYKDNWRLVSLDLDAPDGWAAEKAGRGLDGGELNGITIEYGNGAPGCSLLWLDALCFTSGERLEKPYLDIAQNRYGAQWPKAVHSPGEPHSNGMAPLSGGREWYGDGTPRFAGACAGYYGVDFGCLRVVDRVDVRFYDNPTGTAGNHGEAVPERAWLEACDGDSWREIPCMRVSPARAGLNRFGFSAVTARRVRVCFEAQAGKSAAVYGFSCYNTASLPLGDAAVSASRGETLCVDAVEVMLNKQINGNGEPLGDLVARIYDLDGDGRLNRCLFETAVPEASVIPFAVTRIPVGVRDLPCGGSYALALGQTSRAVSREEGDYYRWVAGQGGFAGRFGIFTGGETKPSDYDWGTAWMRVHCGGMVRDYSGDYESLGVRFGIDGLENRYMTFTIPDRVTAAFDGSARGPAGWPARDGDVIRVAPGRPCLLRGVNIWLEGALPDRIAVACGGATVAEASGFVQGFNAIRFSAEGAESIEVSLHGLLDVCTVHEIEIIGEEL